MSSFSRAKSIVDFLYVMSCNKGLQRDFICFKQSLPVINFPDDGHDSADSLNQQVDTLTCSE